MCRKRSDQRFRRLVVGSQVDASTPTGDRRFRDMYCMVGKILLSGNMAFRCSRRHCVALGTHHAPFGWELSGLAVYSAVCRVDLTECASSPVSISTRFVQGTMLPLVFAALTMKSVRKRRTTLGECVKQFRCSSRARRSLTTRSA